MKKIIIKNDNGVVLNGNVYLANNWYRKFVGLMDKKNMPEEDGMFFLKEKRIHCHFMKFTIDVVYFDENLTVLFVETVKPWSIGSKVIGAKHLLEVNESIGQKFQVGEKVTIEKGDS